MKKKTFINPAIYALFILSIVALVILTIRIIETKTYPNLTKQIASYVMEAILPIGILYIGKDILKPIPLYYNESEIIIVRYFKENITISYKDIKKATYTNIYSTLKIYTEDKTYRFKYLEDVKDLLKLLKQKVKDVNF